MQRCNLLIFSILCNLYKIHFYNTLYLQIKKKCNINKKERQNSLSAVTEIQIYRLELLFETAVLQICIFLKSLIISCVLSKIHTNTDLQKNCIEIIGCGKEMRRKRRKITQKAVKNLYKISRCRMLILPVRQKIVHLYGYFKQNMESFARRKKCIATVRMEKYLVEYLTSKYNVHPDTGGVHFPPGSDLYVLIWDLMRPSREKDEGMDACTLTEGELIVHLPCSGKKTKGISRKSPEYWNFLSMDAQREIRGAVSLLFNYEFHQFMLKNEESGRTRQIREAVNDFIRKYRIRSISEDGLLKNFMRYRQKLVPSKKRKYTRNFKK